VALAVLGAVDTGGTVDAGGAVDAFGAKETPDCTLNDRKSAGCTEAGADHLSNHSGSFALPKADAWALQAGADAIHVAEAIDVGTTPTDRLADAAAVAVAACFPVAIAAALDAVVCVVPAVALALPGHVLVLLAVAAALVLVFAYLRRGAAAKVGGAGSFAPVPASRPWPPGSTGPPAPPSGASSAAPALLAAAAASCARE